jgi:O-antigen polymerase
MRTQWKEIRTNLRQPWLLSVLCIALIPLFPEYVCPLLAGASLWAASRDARLHGRFLAVGTVGKFVLLYMAYMALSILFSANPLSSLSTFAMWVVMFLLYTAMTTVLTTKHRFDTALFCIAIVAGIVGFIGMAQYALNAFLGVHTSMQFWNWIDPIIYKWLPMSLEMPDFGLRVASTFNNPNILAEYLIMVLPFVIYYAFSGERSRVRMLCRVCLLFAVGGIALSFSRGSYLALLCIAAVLCIANIRKIVVILMSAVSLLFLMPSSIMERLFSVGSSTDFSINQRWQIWAVGLRGFAENPIFGYGAGVQNGSDLLLAAGLDVPHMHNLVLELLIEGGLIGLFLMLLVGFHTLRGSVHLAMRTDSRAMGVALVGFVAAFCMFGLVDFPLLSPKLVAVFMMVLGFADCAGQLYLGDKSDPMSALFSSSLLRRRASRDSVAYFQPK